MARPKEEYLGAPLVPALVQGADAYRVNIFLHASCSLGQVRQDESHF